MGQSRYRCFVGESRLLMLQALMQIARDGSYVCRRARIRVPICISRVLIALCVILCDVCEHRGVFPVCVKLCGFVSISERENIGAISAYTQILDLHTYRRFGMAPTVNTHIHTYRNVCNLLSDDLDDAMHSLSSQIVQFENL